MNTNTNSAALRSALSLSTVERNASDYAPAFLSHDDVARLTVLGAARWEGAALVSVDPKDGSEVTYRNVTAEGFFASRSLPPRGPQTEGPLKRALFFLP